MMDKLTVRTRYMKYYGRRAFHTHFVHKFPNLPAVLELIKTIHQQAMDEEDIAQEALTRMENEQKEKKRLELLERENQSNALVLASKPPEEVQQPKADEPEKKPASVIKPFVDLRDTDITIKLNLVNPHVTLNVKRIIDMDYDHTVALTDYRPIVFDAKNLHEHTALTLQERDALLVYDYDTVEALFCIFRKFRDAMNMMYLYTGNKSIQAIERVDCEHPKKRNKSRRRYRFTDNIDYNVYASLPKVPEPQRPFFASAKRRLSTHIESSNIFGEQFSQISFMCHRFFLNIYTPTWYMFSDDDVDDDDEDDDDENNHNNAAKPARDFSNDEPTEDDLLRYSVAQKIQWIEMFSTYYAGAYYVSAGHTSAGLMMLDRVTPMFNKYFADTNPEISLLHQVELLYFSLMRPLEYRLAKKTYKAVKALVDEDKLQERRMKWSTFLTKCQNQLVKNRHIYYQMHEKENEFINSVRPVDYLQKRLFLDDETPITLYDKFRVEDKVSLLSAVLEANPDWNGVFYAPRKRIFPDELTYSQRKMILCEDQ
jgi:hypothetical protein